MQEIWSRIALYNFCEIIATNVVINEKKGYKHTYQLNYTERFGFAVTFYQ